MNSRFYSLVFTNGIYKYWYNIVLDKTSPVNF